MAGWLQNGVFKVFHSADKEKKVRILGRNKSVASFRILETFVFEKDLFVHLGKRMAGLFFLFINMLSVIISGLVTTIIRGDTVVSGSVYHYSLHCTKW